VAAFFDRRGIVGQRAQVAGVRAPHRVRRLFEFVERERRFLLAELSSVKGLMPLLMRRRNQQRRTAEELFQIRAHLRRLSKLSPYFAVFVMPGGFALLPVLAWWLDRRRARRPPSSA
jgi:hypothetical protein